MDTFQPGDGIGVFDGRLTIASWFDVRRRGTVVEVGLDGASYQRFLSDRSDADMKALAHADRCMRHAEMLHKRLPVSDAQVAAIQTDVCLAVEAIFPLLREQLPA